MASKALLGLLVLGALSGHVPASAGNLSDRDDRPRTDAQIITAIDDSGSMTWLKRMLAYRGLAKAVIEPSFLARIAAGSNRRVGFIAFTWSSDGKIDVIVPWMTIANAGDARNAAAMFLKAIDSDPPRPRVATMTDLNLAIATATMLEESSPFVGVHTFINICSDGISNSGASPGSARDHALAKGLTISAVLFFGRPMLDDYYSRNVIGGPGAFILPISDAAAMSGVLTRKFWLDLTS
jgi:hypothetical protein